LSADERTDLPKSLKEQNRPLLWTIIAVNAMFLFAVVHANAIVLDDLRSIVSEPEKLVPVGLAIVISTVLNGLLSTDAKARLVFLRWRNALPGHRAFSEYAASDSRIAPNVLKNILGGALPVDPVEQNRTWYRLYKTVEKEPAVDQVHRDFLLLRDYTGLSVLFFIFNGAVALYALSSWKVFGLYLVELMAQYAVARQAAAHYGVRMVTTVLAQKMAEPSASGAPPHRPKKRTVVH
jgi:hypothetical protein